MFFFLSIFFPKGQLPVSYLIIFFLICTFIYLAKIPLQGPRYQLGGSNFFCFVSFSVHPELPDSNAYFFIAFNPLLLNSYRSGFLSNFFPRFSCQSVIS